LFGYSYTSQKWETKSIFNQKRMKKNWNLSTYDDVPEKTCVDPETSEATSYVAVET